MGGAMKSGRDMDAGCAFPATRDELIQVSKGVSKADVVIKNGKMVNVYTGEIYREEMAIKGRYIAALGPTDHLIGPSTQVIDAEAGYVMPGFIETHMHVDGSHLNMSEFARALLCHGTTTVSTDLMHIGIVGGI